VIYSKSQVRGSLLDSISPEKRVVLLCRVSFICFFFSGVQTAVTYVLFRSNPRWGTGVCIAESCATLYLAGLFLLAFGGRSISWPATSKWIFYYVAFTGLSLTWSQSSSIAHALGYWIGFAAELGAVVCLLSSGNADEISIAALSGSVWAAVIVAVIAWSAPGTWELRMGDQQFLHPNAVGNQFGIAALFGLYLARREPAKRYWNWLTLGLSFSLLRSLSKASIISFVCAAGFYLFRGSDHNLRSKVKVALIFVGMFACSWTFISAYLDVYTDGTNNIETITGRTVIWATSFDIANEHPWLGHGFYSYRSIVPPFGEFESWHAHNDLLQQYFSYGLVGVLLALSIYISFFRHILRCRESGSIQALAFAILIYGLLHGLTDADHVELMLPARLILLVSVWLSSNIATQKYLTLCI